MSDRSGVLRGNDINLIVTFLNSRGVPTDPTSLSLNIYPPGYNPDSGALPGDAWVYGATLASGGSGPLSDPLKTISKISDGSFMYTFTVPASSDGGLAFDQWIGTIGGEEIDNTPGFVVVGGGSVSIDSLYKNNRVTIYLSEDIKAIDGSTLESDDMEKYFTTSYDPLHASSLQLRLHLGPIAKDLSDDAINLAIFEASLSANANIFMSTIENSTYFTEARKGYTICKAQMILLQALSGDGSLVGGFKKTLGDLSVSKFGNDDFIKSRLNNLEECVDGWLSVLQSGGELGRFGLEKAGTAVKGSMSGDAISETREWSPLFVGERPIANSSTYRHDMTSSRRKYRTYTRRTRGRRNKW